MYQLAPVYPTPLSSFLKTKNKNEEIHQYKCHFGFKREEWTQRKTWVFVELVELVLIFIHFRTTTGFGLKKNSIFYIYTFVLLHLYFRRFYFFPLFPFSIKHSFRWIPNNQDLRIIINREMSNNVRRQSNPALLNTIQSQNYTEPLLYALYFAYSHFVNDLFWVTKSGKEKKIDVCFVLVKKANPNKNINKIIIKRYITRNVSTILSYRAYIWLVAKIYFDLTIIAGLFNRMKQV